MKPVPYSDMTSEVFASASVDEGSTGRVRTLLLLARWLSGRVRSLGNPCYFSVEQLENTCQGDFRILTLYTERTGVRSYVRPSVRAFGFMLRRGCAV
jgi:hypothetical protein